MIALITDHREDTLEERTTYAPINGAVRDRPLPRGHHAEGPPSLSTLENP